MAQLAASASLPAYAGPQPSFYLEPEQTPVAIQDDSLLQVMPLAKIQELLCASWARLPQAVHLVAAQDTLSWIEIVNSKPEAWSGKYTPKSCSETGQAYLRLDLEDCLGRQVRGTLNPALPWLDEILVHEIYGHALHSLSLRRDPYGKIVKHYQSLICAPAPFLDQTDTEELRQQGEAITKWTRAKLQGLPFDPSTALAGLPSAPASLLLFNQGWRTGHYEKNSRFISTYRRELLSVCPAEWQSAWLKLQPLPEAVTNQIMAAALQKTGAQVTLAEYWQALHMQDAAPNSYSFKNIREAFAETMTVELYHLEKEFHCERAAQYLRSKVPGILLPSELEPSLSTFDETESPTLSF